MRDASFKPLQQLIWKTPEFFFLLFIENNLKIPQKENKNRKLIPGKQSVAMSETMIMNFTLARLAQINRDLKRLN